jgi:hypothetical protein
LKRLLPVLLLCAIAAHAQSAIPINDSTENWASWVTGAVNDLILSGTNPLISMALDWLRNIAIVMVVIMGLKVALASAAGSHGHLPLPEAVELGTWIVIAFALLHYYSTPLPFAGISFHQLFPETARQISAVIDLKSLDDLLAEIRAIQMNLESPSLWDVQLVLVYFSVLLNLLFVKGLLFLVTSAGFIGTGVFSLLGPLTIPFLITKRFSWIFYNWLSAMISFSFYQVIGAALTFVWCHFLIAFIHRTVHGDYTLAHWMTLVVPFGAINLAFFASILLVTYYVTDFFKGTATTGAGFGSSLSGAAVRLLA